MAAQHSRGNGRGPKRKTRAQRRRDARMQEAVQLRERGWSLRNIASFLDVHHDTVREDLIRAQALSDSASDSGVGNPADSAGNPTAKSDGNIVRFPERRAS